MAIFFNGKVCHPETGCRICTLKIDERSSDRGKIIKKKRAVPTSSQGVVDNSKCAGLEQCRYLQTSARTPLANLKKVYDGSGRVELDATTVLRGKMQIWEVNEELRRSVYLRWGKIANVWKLSANVNCILIHRTWL